MGKALISIYEDAKKIGGLGAQIRLAVLTKLPSVKAEAATDSQENIDLFHKSLEIVRKEFAK
jgi:hypothetical protein